MECKICGKDLYTYEEEERGICEECMEIDETSDFASSILWTDGMDPNIEDLC